MRKVLALILCVAVQVAALSAPLVHAHPDEHATEHHSGREVHAHWTGHGSSHESSDEASLDAADHDRAVFLDAFVAVASSSVPAFGLIHEGFDEPVPAERAAHRVMDIVRSHDPPFLASLSSRAPPTFLS